jgi:hypothetical protein
MHLMVAVVDLFLDRTAEIVSVLDIVRNKIKELQVYKPPNEPRKPQLHLQEGKDYLRDFEPRSYKWFAAKVQVDNRQESDEKHKEEYKRDLERWKGIEGVKEKREALLEMTQKYKKLESALLEKDAKTGKQLYPDAVFRDINYHTRSWPDNGPKFAPTFDFKVDNLSDTTREGYIRL